MKFNLYNFAILIISITLLSSCATTGEAFSETKEAPQSTQKSATTEPSKYGNNELIERKMQRASELKIVTAPE